MMNKIALRAAEGSHQAIFNSMADPVLVADRQNRFIDANAAALDLLGVSREEILMQQCSNVFAYDEPGHVCFLRNTIFLGRTLRDRKETVLTPGGERVDVLVTASPLVGPGGEMAGAVYVLRDLRSDQRATRELRREAATDELTGLVNRRELRRGLEVEVARAKRHGRPMSALMLDLDGFKRYNDANGHLAGDEALKVMGKLLSTDSRKEDITARYGGEEFVIVLPEVTPEQAARRAERLRKEIASWPFEGGSITASIGVLNCDSASGMEAKDILRHVDEALYEAKRTGKDRVVVYRPRKG